MRYDLLHPKALRAALIEYMGEDAVPTERQVRRWISGDSPMPGWARRAVDGLMGTTKEAAPPAWEERLARVESLLVEIARATPGVRPELLEIHERVLELERARQQRGEQRQPADPDAQGTPPGTLR